MADWAANDYTFKMGLTFYFQELSQNFPLERVPRDKTTVVLRKPQIFSTVVHHTESIHPKAASTN